MDFSRYVLMEENYDDQRFGPVAIFYNPADPQDIICVKTRSFASEPEFLQRLAAAEERLRFCSPFLLKMLYVRPERETLRLEICFEYPNEDLFARAEALRRPAELLKLLHDALCGMAFLEKHRMVHGNIRPEYLFFSEKEGNYILLDRLGDFLSPAEAQRENVANGLCLYLDPLLFAGVWRGDLQPAVSPFKAETFALGLTALSLVIYSGGEAEDGQPPMPLQEVFDRETGRFDEPRFLALLEEIRLRCFPGAEDELVFDFIADCLLNLDLGQRLGPYKAFKLLKETLWKISTSKYNSLSPPLKDGSQRDAPLSVPAIAVLPPVAGELAGLMQSKRLSSESEFSKADPGDLEFGHPMQQLSMQESEPFIQSLAQNQHQQQQSEGSGSRPEQFAEGGQSSRLSFSNKSGEIAKPLETAEHNGPPFVLQGKQGEEENARLSDSGRNFFSEAEFNGQGGQSQREVFGSQKQSLQRQLRQSGPERERDSSPNFFAYSPEQQDQVLQSQSENNFQANNEDFFDKKNAEDSMRNVFSEANKQQSQKEGLLFGQIEEFEQPGALPILDDQPKESRENEHFDRDPEQIKALESNSQRQLSQKLRQEIIPQISDKHFKEAQPSQKSISDRNFAPSSFTYQEQNERSSRHFQPEEFQRQSEQRIPPTSQGSASYFLNNPQPNSGSQQLLLVNPPSQKSLQAKGQVHSQAFFQEQITTGQGGSQNNFPLSLPENAYNLPQDSDYNSQAQIEYARQYSKINDIAFAQEENQNLNLEEITDTNGRKIVSTSHSRIATEGQDLVRLDSLPESQTRPQAQAPVLGQMPEGKGHYQGSFREREPNRGSNLSSSERQVPSLPLLSPDQLKANLVAPESLKQANEDPRPISVKFVEPYQDFEFEEKPEPLAFFVAPMLHVQAPLNFNEAPTATLSGKQLLVQEEKEEDERITAKEPLPEAEDRASDRALKFPSDLQDQFFSPVQPQPKDQAPEEYESRASPAEANRYFMKENDSMISSIKPLSEAATFFKGELSGPTRNRRQTPDRLARRNFNKILAGALTDSLQFPVAEEDSRLSDFESKGRASAKDTLLQQIDLLEPTTQNRPVAQSLFSPSQQTQGEPALKKHSTPERFLHIDYKAPLKDAKKKKMETIAEEAEIDFALSKEQTEKLSQFSSAKEHMGSMFEVNSQEMREGGELSRPKKQGRQTPKTSLVMPELFEFNDNRSFQQFDTRSHSLYQSVQERQASDFHGRSAKGPETQYMRKFVTTFEQNPSKAKTKEKDKDKEDYKENERELEEQKKEELILIEEENKRPSLYKTGSAKFLGNPDNFKAEDKEPLPELDFKKKTEAPQNPSLSANVIYISGHLQPKFPPGHSFSAFASNENRQPQISDFSSQTRELLGPKPPLAFQLLAPGPLLSLQNAPNPIVRQIFPPNWEAAHQGVLQAQPGNLHGLLTQSTVQVQPSIPQAKEPVKIQGKSEPPMLQPSQQVFLQAQAKALDSPGLPPKTEATKLASSKPPPIYLVPTGQLNKQGHMIYVQRPQPVSQVFDKVQFLPQGGIFEANFLRQYGSQGSGYFTGNSNATQLTGQNQQDLRAKVNTLPSNAHLQMKAEQDHIFYGKTNPLNFPGQSSNQFSLANQSKVPFENQGQFPSPEKIPGRQLEPARPFAQSTNTAQTTPQPTNGVRKPPSFVVLGQVSEQRLPQPQPQVQLQGFVHDFSKKAQPISQKTAFAFAQEGPFSSQPQSQFQTVKASGLVAQTPQGQTPVQVRKVSVQESAQLQGGVQSGGLFQFNLPKEKQSPLAQKRPVFLNEQKTRNSTEKAGPLITGTIQGQNQGQVQGKAQGPQIVAKR